MIMNLIDWKGEKHPVDIGDLDNIEEMFIKVVTGDEILHVLYKDGTDKFFDSSEDRMVDFDDGIYPIYVSGLWCIDKDKFMNRKTSYDLLNSEIMDKMAQLIADLQNELDKANNRIDELAEENNKLTCDNILLKEDNLIVNKRINKLVKENNKLTNENMILDEDNIRVNKKYYDYNQAAQDAWNENNKIKNEIEKLKNENEYLEGIIDWVISENDELSKEITKWYNKYTKEKAKHDKATKKIDELNKNQEERKYDNYILLKVMRDNKDKLC